MPRPDSKKGIPITAAGFEAPFETVITRFGVKGLNLIDAVDAVEQDELTSMVNVTHRMNADITTRPGQALLATAGTNHHTIKRLNDPLNSTFTRLFGVDTNLYIGQSGALTVIDSGYSGNPLSMVPYRPPFSSETWMFIADTNKMSKVRPDGLVLPIGLPAPSVAAGASLDTEQDTAIANFQDDGTIWSNWTPNAGMTFDNPPVPTPVPIVGPVSSPVGVSDGAFFQTAVVGNQANGYYNFWGVPKTMDLSVVGAKPASDDDYIHLWLNFSHVNIIQEFRVYLVCADVFSPSILPGISDADGVNGDAFLKSFSGNDFGTFIQGQATQTSAAETARIRSLRDQDLANRAITQDFPSDLTDQQKADIASRTGTILSASDPSKTITVQSPSGNDRWLEYGVLGLPVRRGDFQRIGTTAGRGWDTITGIVVYVSAGANSQAVVVRLANVFLTGGSGPDTGEPTAVPYDYRYTHYDTRTGAEGNPSPTMDVSNYIDTIRRAVIVSPTPYGDASVHQRIYRRGGSLPTDWFFLGQTGGDGAAFTDTLSDNEASTATTVVIDNNQPVPATNASGNTVLASPLSSLWGPLEDLLFGCGNALTPGYLYFCKPGAPDSWSPFNFTEVCAPSEQLMAGCLFGGQSFVFSQERLFVLYPNLGGQITQVTSTVTQCKRGMINNRALAVGLGGMYFVARDGVYVTAGGTEQWLSRKIDPIFRGLTVNGVLPIDFTQLSAIHLAIHENELYFLYQDTGGTRQVMVYSIPLNFWRQYTFNIAPSTLYEDEGNPVTTLLIGGHASGQSYNMIGLSDNGSAIPCNIRTGAITAGVPRQEKSLGDQVLDVDTQGVVVTLQNRINTETITNPAQTYTASPGRTRAIFDGFGTTPQRGRDISTNLSWSSATAAPIVYLLGTSAIIEPEITNERSTQWDDLSHPDESYLMGVTFDCNTSGGDKTVIVEYDLNGVVNQAATLIVNTTGRHKVKFSWPAVQAHKVRIRPDDVGCAPWILYKVDWISVPEPPRIATWDTHFENAWDQYYTGLDIMCDTFGMDKIINIYVDETLILTETVNTTGRRVHHVTLPWGRGHVFRFVATDLNPGLLYQYKWHTEAEPSEQANWNQNFTTEHTEADKFIKALVLQCDTFGVDKTVTLECDGVVVETITVNTSGRKVVQFSFPQHLGRVFRVFPTDTNPGRLYSIWWVFDQEPLALARWETQEIDHNFPGWHYPIGGHVAIKSVSDVTLSVTAYNQSGAATTETYTIPSTSGVKQKAFVPFRAGKGILYKYILTSTDPFWLYREETALLVREWGSDKSVVFKPFGNDDLDVTRVMTKASSAADRSGGGTQ